MILATHLIVGAYGFWLPNDPRGSWSDFVGSYELAKFGPATKTDTRRSVAGHEHNRVARLAAKKALKHPAVIFTGLQARAVGQGFANYIGTAKVVCHACSIMTDHVHLVLATHCLSAESLMVQLKGAASKQMLSEQIHPFQTLGEDRPKCFARGEWKVFLNTPEDVRRAIEYVERNPLKDGKPRQQWSFVTPFVG